MYSSAGYTVVETLREDKEFILLRGQRISDQAPILLESPVHSDSSTAVAERFEKEYALRGDLDPAWAILPVGQDRIGDRPTLVFGDPGGQTLARTLERPLDFSESLRIAVGMASAVGKLHARDLIHKDIKPENFLVDDSGAVRLMGFGEVSRLPRERQEPGPPEVMAGTLAYMSPEQTGRMNRSVDSRSDLYSLGITLYELFAGSLPFQAGDPLEWVHCHIARLPVPLHERNPGVPAQVSAVVMKLLAKVAESRYQTAAGLEADLRRCLEAWEERGRVERFHLGQRDVPARLLIPEKLYGREKESRRLLEAFGRVESTGKSEIVIVSGYSGIGKSSLVNELHRSLVRSRGLFASAKYEWQGRGSPYAIFSRAFQNLATWILAGKAEEVAAWRAKILEAVGPDGRVITDILPDLELLIGKQQEVPALSLVEARNRFHDVFVRFLGAIARPEHPLVLYLDDLQWLDSSCLDLLVHLATNPEVRYLLLIVAYRDNEVGPSHPLVKTLASIREDDAAVNELRLSPLGPEDIRRLIVDALHCGREEALPLAQVIRAKTGGNAFFAIQFLNVLYEERLLAFDPARAAWIWDVEAIRGRSFTDNVADLVVGKLERQPAETLEILKRLSCLGGTAEASTLGLILGRREKEIHDGLWSAVYAGLVWRSREEYHFLHDRIQEAAYSLIPEDRRAGMHLAIGRALMAGRVAPESEEDGVFTLLDQLNLGLALITDPGERETVRRLNALAGRKSMAAVAFDSARSHFELARGMLPEGSWETGYEETVALLLDAAEAEYMAGQGGAAGMLFEEVLSRARSGADAARAYRIQARLYQISGLYQLSLEAGMEGMRRLGMAFPADKDVLAEAIEAADSGIRAQLAGRPIASLADSPSTTDEEARAFIALAADSIAPAYLAKSPYYPLIVLHGVGSTLRHGTAAGSATLFAVYAILAVDRGGDPGMALEFSDMAVRLNENTGDPRQRGVVLYLQATISVLRRPIAASIPILQESFLASQRVGDISSAGYAAIIAIWARLEAGQTIDELGEAAIAYLGFARRSRNEATYHSMKLFLRFLAGFREPRDWKRMADRILEMEDPEYERGGEGGSLDAFRKGGNTIGIVMSHVLGQMECAIFDRPEEALGHALEAERDLVSVTTSIHEADQPFFHALAAAALHYGAAPDRRAELARVVEAKLRPLRRMAGMAPENYGNRLALILAEAARMEGRDLDAMRLYEQAIRSAKEDGFVLRESLADEVAARFYLDRGFETAALAYLRNARAGYLRWGATAKARQLERAHPDLAEPAREGASIFGAASEGLDLLAVVKASQAVSGEIEREAFIERLFTIILENAGADRGLLVQPRDGGFIVEAEAEAGREVIRVRTLDEEMRAEHLPESMIRLAFRTREQVILDDATSGQYAGEEYVRRHAPRSVLVLPLIKQSAIVAVLYLENRLTPRTFTPGRVSVVRLLASQAAISLENARLYGSLRRAEERFSKAFRNNPSPMAIFRAKGGALVDANKSFFRIFGYAREEFIGRSPREIGLLDRGASEELEALAGAQGFLRDTEVSVRDKGGRPLSLLTSMEPIELEGKPCVLVTCVDITGRKQMESQLRQSQKMEAIGRMAAGVAHDFNNLLTAINGFSSIALEGMAPDDPNHDIMREILKAGERASTLTRQLLAHSRTQAQQSRPWSLNVIAGEMTPMLKRLIGEDIRLDTDFDPELGLAQLDRGQVEQILLNLVVNARDAMPGTGRIVIRTGNAQLNPLDRGTHLEAAPGAHVMLSVSDTGSGMPAEVLSRLFEPFFTTKPQGKGTGLGLSVVYGIVKQSGGGISVFSEPGAGTVFRIYFPRLAVHDEPARAQALPPALDTLRGEESILLVEDSPAVRKFAALALQAQGYRVAEAGNGLQALEVLEKRRDIRLVVTDVVMPEMGGAALAVRLGAIRPDLPIVFMSGFVEHAEVRDLIAESGEGLLRKPFTPVELARAVREKLDAAVRSGP